MKVIVAVIRIERLEAVRAALARWGLYLTSVTRVVGGGRDPGCEAIYRGTKFYLPRPCLRLELAVHGLFVEAAVEAIVGAAFAEDPRYLEDGKLFVMPLEVCVTPVMEDAGQRQGRKTRMKSASDAT